MAYFLFRGISYSCQFRFLFLILLLAFFNITCRPFFFVYLITLTVEVYFVILLPVCLYRTYLSFPFMYIFIHSHFFLTIRIIVIRYLPFFMCACILIVTREVSLSYYFLLRSFVSFFLHLVPSCSYFFSFVSYLDTVLLLSFFCKREGEFSSYASVVSQRVIRPLYFSSLAVPATRVFLLL